MKKGENDILLQKSWGKHDEKVLKALTKTAIELIIKILLLSYDKV